VDHHHVRVTDLTPAIGHNRGAEAIDPVSALTDRLAATHSALVARFADLELGCARVPDPIANREEAGLITDFIAQCQVHLRQAEAGHKREKAPFLAGGRTVDAFFKRRCERLGAALAPVVLRLKAYRDRVVVEEGERHEAARRAAQVEAERARAEERHHRTAAERLARDADTTAERRAAAEHLAQAEAAAARARAAGERTSLVLPAIRIEGDYGAVAYVTRSWSFEVVDLARVPRRYLSLDTERVRNAITKEGVRDIPGLRVVEREELRVRGAA
jgi:hypothetical protein